jgi:hypothetical protein
MKNHLIFVAAFVLLLTACASPQKPLPADSLSEEWDHGLPFAGLWMETAEQGGTLILGLVAGPAAIAGLLPGDRILRVDDIEVDAAQMQSIIAASSPGTRLLLHLMRGDRPLQIELVIDARERWSGPAAYNAATPYTDTRLGDTSQLPDLVIKQALVEEAGLVQVNQQLDRMFADLARGDVGYHKLPLIRRAFIRPGSMTDWRKNLVTQMRLPVNGRGSLVDVMCETLALECLEPVVEPHDTAASFAEFAATIARANQNVRDVFHNIEGGRAQATADMQYLLEKTAADRTLQRQPDVLRGIRVMQLSMQVDLALLLAITDQLLLNARRLPNLVQSDRKLPDALDSVVKGEIIDYLEVDGGYIVIGGSGPNRYDMEHLYAVIDHGGDDIYEWGDGVLLETQTVIDLEGDDRYEASRGGPAAGWLGVSLLIDRAGNDHYETALGGCGVGVLGFGLLFDDAGVDTYHCAAWSLGTGFYGAGVVIDQGARSDVYLSEVFSQGVGGPRGFGLLLDAGGADLYRANGPVASTYGMPATYMAFSQGVGVGIRPYDFGGVGALLDLGGDDRYEGGEFSQGGGYYWGVGLLYDEAGDDLYYGNRYAQGFAAHQAFGMLADLSGNDVYWSTLAAAQGAAWDQSVAILFDGDGNDLYRAGTLSQGAAAQQARGSLHDLGGDDVYQAADDVVQGAAGDNSYHFTSYDLSAGEPVYSLGVLLDEAGADRYSTGLNNGETRLRLIKEGVVNGKGVAGIAMDRY